MSETTLSTHTAFKGRVLQLDVVEITLPDGRISTREIVRHPGAVVVLAERPDGRFVLVRQYRKAVDATLVEMVAGGLEPNEAPEAAARRELIEESGYAAESLRPLGVLILCPGYSSERLHLFHAKVGMAPGATRPDFDENVATVLMTKQAIETAIARGEIQDSKTISTWHLASCNRAE